MLPFIAGAVLGATAVMTYNKNEKVKKSIDSSVKKVKKVAEEGFEKTKEMAKDMKATVDEKVESFKSKGKEPEVAEAKGE